jgi:hypothetical protein
VEVLLGQQPEDGEVDHGEERDRYIQAMYRIDATKRMPERPALVNHGGTGPQGAG